MSGTVVPGQGDLLPIEEGTGLLIPRGIFAGKEGDSQTRVYDPTRRGRSS